MLRSMISKCKAVPQQFLYYLPHIQKLLPQNNNLSDSETRLCLDNEYKASAGHNPRFHIPCDCRVSCNEMTIKSKITRSTHKQSKFGPIIEFAFDSTTYTEIQELPLYPLTKFVTDIGGWLSLFSGMSLLSVAEIVVFIVLSLLALLNKLKRSIASRRLRENDVNKVM